MSGHNAKVNEIGMIQVRKHFLCFCGVASGERHFRYRSDSFKGLNVDKERQRINIYDVPKASTVSSSSKVYRALRLE